MKRATLIAVSFCAATLFAQSKNLDIYVARRRGRKRHAVCDAVARGGAHRHRQRRACRGARCRPHHGCSKGRGHHADRCARDVALARRSHGRDGRAGRPYPDSPLHRSRRQRAAGRRDRRVSAEHLSRSVAKSKHTVVKAGDTLPLKGVEWRFVTSARETIKSPLPGAGRPNPHCAGFKPHTVNPVSGRPLGNTEDEHSVGSHVTFGKFRALYLADFPWNKEFELMCPDNRLGTVEFLLVSRHGQHSSNSRSAGARAAAARRRHQQRHSQGRTARDDAGAAFEPGAGRFMAGSRRAAERAGIRHPRDVRRQHRRRSAAQPGALD